MKQLHLVNTDAQMLLTQSMMTTKIILQLLPVLVVSATTTTTPATPPPDANCVVEWDDGNVVATQLEGSWVMNKELSLVLSPWSDTIVIDEIK